MSWPGHINDPGGIRRQFHHLIDIAPTILEATGIPEPDMLNGIKQRPMDGVSMAYTWDKANANAPDRHTRQYFEMLGNRAIYSDGWIAATTPATLPWALSTAAAPDVITGYKWELYNVKEDPTESNDLAATMPDKLKQMQDLFYVEAKKYDVLPLDNTSLTRWNGPKPNLTGGRTVFTYTGGLTGIPNSGAPNILNKSYSITADIEIPKDGAQGVIVTDGGRFGGYALFLSQSDNWWLRSTILKVVVWGLFVLGLFVLWLTRNRHRPLWRKCGYALALIAPVWLIAGLIMGAAHIGKSKPVFLYNLLDLKRTTWAGPALGTGKHTIVFDFKSDAPGLGKGGTGVLYVDGKEVAQNSMEHTTPITFPEDETFDIGEDTRTGVAMLQYRYDVPFKFTGTINKLTFNLGPQSLTAEEQKQLPAIADAVARAKD
jgi:hypothetical protein